MAYSARLLNSTRGARSGAVLCLLLAAAVAGCATSELSKEERAMVEQRQEMVRQNELQLQRLKRLQEMTEIQFLEMELKRLRAQWAREAATALSEKRYARCLARIHDVFNPPPKTDTVKEPVFQTDGSGNPTDKQAVGPDGKPQYRDVTTKRPYPVVELDRTMEAALRAMMGTVKFEQAKQAEGEEEAQRLMEECIAAYRQAQQIDPKNRDARRNLGRILFQQARRDTTRSAHWYKQALHEWQAELAMGVRDAELMVLVGQALYETGHKEAAARSFEIAIPEMPENLDLLKFISSAYAETGRCEEALRLYDVLLRKEPFHTDFTAHKAHLLSQLGRVDEAVATLEMLEAAGRMQRRHWILLGDLEAQAGAPGPAADAFLAAYDRGGRLTADPGEQIVLADLLVQANRPAAPLLGRKTSDLDRAEAILTDLADGARLPGICDRDKADVFFTLARLHRIRAGMAPDEPSKVRDLTYAIDANRRGLALSDTNGNAWLAVADMSFQLGQKDFKIGKAELIDDAFEAYTRASSLPESEADGYFGLGDVHYCRGDLGKAVDSYKLALEARPGDPIILNALQAVSAEFQRQSAN